MKPDAFEDCVSCDKQIGIFFDSYQEPGELPVYSEEILGGFRCDHCQKVVHAACARNPDVCDPCDEILIKRTSGHGMTL